MCKKTYLKKFVVMGLLLLTICCAAASADTIYVDTNASGPTHDGSTWANAYTSLQDGLDDAGTGDEIWVAAGTYYPTSDYGLGIGDRGKHFRMINDVGIYGGFPTGGDTFANRDPNQYETVLSGDIGVPGEIDDNCYHVFYHPDGLALDYNAILDGFTITAGNANVGDYSSPTGNGGGMYNSKGNPTVVNCIFRNNTALWNGGAMVNYDSDPVLINCKYNDNRAVDNDGGAMDNNTSNPTLINCTFRNNSSYDWGGGMRNIYESSPTLINCIFSQNSSRSGSGMYNYDNSNPMLTNCVFSGNTAIIKGGGVYNDKSNPVVINTTLTGNSSQGIGGGVCSSDDSFPTLTNCILWNNIDRDGMDENAQLYGSTPLVNYSCIQGWSGFLGGIGNIGGDPLFVDAYGVDNIIGTGDDDLRLFATSPCLGSGYNAAIGPDTADLDDDGDTAEPIPFDLDGNPRVINGTVDMGAYEGAHQRFLLSTKSITVPEGQTATFTVAIAMDPAGAVEVTVAGISGDPDITITDGGTVIFDSSNYWIPQTITLAAAEDGDMDNSTTMIRISSEGTTAFDVTAMEWDNDVPEVLYVDPSALGANDGTSWEDAFIDLQDALNFAETHPQVEQIRVAQGIYKPDETTANPNGTGDREATFQLVNGDELYGGFPSGGGEWEERDPEAYETILSGDLNSDDGPDFTNISENSYHVVTCTGNDPNTILDGITISGGNADVYYYNADGGGILLLYNSNPAISNCTFVNNSARSYGGGMFTGALSSPSIINCTFKKNSTSWGGGIYNAEDSSPIIDNCIFKQNEGTGAGGGIANYTSDALIINCIFSENRAGSGGGVKIRDCSPILTNCSFFGNVSTGSNDGGGGISNSSWNDECNPLITNCIFIGNLAIIRDSVSYRGVGGGISNRQAHSSCNPIISNCTFGHNSAILGNAVYNEGANLSVTNCIFWDDSESQGISENSQIHNGGIIDLNYSCVQGWTGNFGGVGNIGEDPLFVDAYGMDGIIGTEDDDLRLLAGSPCLDAGDSNSVPADIYTDIDGNPRFADDLNTADTGIGLPPIVDMGAYEGANQGFLFSKRSFAVPEGAQESFTIALAKEPLVSVEVIVTVLSGDPDITVFSGESLVFNPENYSKPQTVILNASEDSDNLNGTTVIQIGATGFSDYKISITEWDNDVSEVIYVDRRALGSDDGTSWTNAFIDLQDALSFAQTHPSVEEIRVAEGTYTPAGPGGDRETRFQLINGITIKGGFAGIGQSNPDARDIEKHQTILSGDLNLDDVELMPGLALPADYCIDAEEVFAGSYYEGLMAGATLDFRMCQETAQGSFHLTDVWYYFIPEINRDILITVTSENGFGSGKYYYISVHDDCYASSVLECGEGSVEISVIAGTKYYIRVATVLNRDFVMKIQSNADNSYAVVNSSNTDCTAVLDGFTITSGNACYTDSYSLLNRDGGGLYNINGSPVITGCTFRNNIAIDSGAGMFSYGGAPLLNNCKFQNNAALLYGGGLYNRTSDLKLTNCVFSQNTASSGGGVYNRYNIIMTNCVFSQNTASSGGGMRNNWGISHLTDCLFKNNSADRGGGMLNARCKITMNNCTIQNNYAETYGGGIKNDAKCDLEFINCIFEGNSASRGGGNCWTTCLQ